MFSELKLNLEPIWTKYLCEFDWLSKVRKYDGDIKGNLAIISINLFHWKCWNQ